MYEDTQMSEDEYMYEHVTRAPDGTLYMAYYFPQFHIAPENKLQLETENNLYTDWDVIRQSNRRSITPLEFYDLKDQQVLDHQDELAHSHGIGVFIFYHYWLDNSLVLNLPVEHYLLKKRKTKFMFLWDNESGFLGKQLYDSPEKHAYQMIRFFQSENYLRDKHGRCPFLIYHAQTMDDEYLSTFVSYVQLYGVKLKLGFNYQQHKLQWHVPSWGEIASEFGPHLEGGATRGDLYSYKARSENLTVPNEYWQGATVAWDSRPRCASGRTAQKSCAQEQPNGQVSPEGFGKLLRDINLNRHIQNRDNVVTLFAWNEWSEGATLEPTEEFGSSFIAQLKVAHVHL